MSDKDEFPKEEVLRKLSRVSIVVYAVRCALRVQPLLALWEKSTADYKKDIVTLNSEYTTLFYGAAARAASSRAAAAAAAGAGSRTACATAAVAVNAATYAAYAADATAAAKAGADAAAKAVIAAAKAGGENARAYYDDAADDAYLDAADAARTDYARLLELKTEVTDASETGPLGDLWYGSPPEWYIEAKAKYDKTISEWEREVAEEEGEETGDISDSEKMNISTTSELTSKQEGVENEIAGPLIVYIDSDAYTAEEKGELLSLFSELYSLQSHDRLVIDHKGTASAVHAEIVGPNGGDS